MIGRYINLDRSIERRAFMDQQIAHLGLESYSRFPATDGRTLDARASTLTAGELGCYQSHLRAIEAAQTESANSHILEDDVILSVHVLQCEPLIETALERFDIVFTDMFVYYDTNQLRLLKAACDAAARSDPPKFELIDLAAHAINCMPSYFVSPAGAAKIAVALRRSWDLGPSEPVDVTLRRSVAAGDVRACCIVPLITSVRLENIVDTTIANRPTHTHDVNNLASALLRYAFFIGADFADYAPRFASVLKPDIAPPSKDARLGLLLRILAHGLARGTA